METRHFRAKSGTIAYRISKPIDRADSQRSKTPCLVFLPGLIADHSLFNRQIGNFLEKADCLVWDPPAHGASRPFKLDYSLDDLATLLRDILEDEQLRDPILIGQSIGGCVSQAFLSLFPGYARGFVGIDSLPLACSYYHKRDLSRFKHTKSMLQPLPWRVLKSKTIKRSSSTRYGQDVMKKILGSFTKKEFCELLDHEYRILGEAIEKTEPDSGSNPFGRPNCPSLLLWGEDDRMGKTKLYNQQWALRTGLSFVEIPRAGHNSNTDAPNEVNKQIEVFINELSREHR